MYLMSRHVNEKGTPILSTAKEKKNQPAIIYKND